MVIRKKIFIDKSVQGTLLTRVFVYWVILLVYFMLGSSCFQYYEHPQWSFSKHLAVWFESNWPWIPSAILILPLVMHDVVRLSHRFVGPIHRLRNQMQQIIVKPDCTALKFRDDDYWQELAEPINELQSEVLALRMALASTKKSLADTLAEKAQAKFVVNQEDDLQDNAQRSSAKNDLVADSDSTTDDAVQTVSSTEANTEATATEAKPEVVLTEDAITAGASQAAETSDETEAASQGAENEQSKPAVPPIDVSSAVAGSEAAAGS